MRDGLPLHLIFDVVVALTLHHFDNDTSIRALVDLGAMISWRS